MESPVSTVSETASPFEPNVPLPVVSDPELEILNSTSKNKGFHERVLEMYNSNCSAQFFMIWLSPAKSLDSLRGNIILKPFLDRGFNAVAVTPDIPFLVKNTPAEDWLEKLKRGSMDPGSIPLFMHLSDLTRLAVLYKYGGIYLDTDIILLNDVTGLRNAIGAERIDAETKSWTILNTAVMVFDIHHPLIREFLHEYSTTFNGNKWGYNSPYLVSRVIQRLGNKPEYNLTIFPTEAFYPVDTIKIRSFFKTPTTIEEVEWVEKTAQNISKGSYAIHLWNKKTRKIKIEEGSVMHKLISTHCTFCKNITNSHT